MSSPAPLGVRQHSHRTCHTPSRQRAKPHIIHVVADDLGYHDVGYRNPHMLTPTLDSLRACGLTLENFYSFKACGPSRASILTGRYPFRMGIYSNEDINNGVPTNFTFLPEILKAAGYATHAVGKWHLGYRSEELTPTRRGFDTFFGFWHCCEPSRLHLRTLLPAAAAPPGCGSSGLCLLDAHQILWKREIDVLPR